MEKITRDELEKFRLNFSRCANFPIYCRQLSGRGAMSQSGLGTDTSEQRNESAGPSCRPLPSAGKVAWEAVWSKWQHLRALWLVRVRRELQISKKWKTKPGNSFWKSLENHIIKWRRRLLVSIFLKLCRLSKVSAVDFFDLFDPLHGISRVIFQVINTFWLKNTKKVCFIDWGWRLFQSNRLATVQQFVNF